MAMASSAAFENDSTAVDGSTNTSSAVSTGRTSSSSPMNDTRSAISSSAARRCEELAQRAVAGDDQVRIDARHAQAPQRGQQHFLILLRARMRPTVPMSSASGPTPSDARSRLAASKATTGSKCAESTPL